MKRVHLQRGAPRLAIPLAVLIVAMALAAGMARDAAGFYGDPRFYPGQASSRVVDNHYPDGYPTDEFLVTAPSGTDPQHLQLMYAAITAWNNAMRATPNSLTKDVFHYRMVNDPNATVIINFVSAQAVDTACGTTNGDACNNREEPTTNIWVDSAIATTALVTHEFGHSLAYSDQYDSDFTCHDGYHTIMNASYTGCETAITATDTADFRSHYEPTYQSANPTYFNTAGATWTVYLGGEMYANFPNSWVEYNYYWEQHADTGGSLLAAGYDALDLGTNGVTHKFGFALATRFCLFDQIHNDVGYPGGRSWSPRSQYSCVGTAQNQSAGFFLGTSNRNSASGNTLYIRVKNFSGGNRDISVWGPGWANIGCPPVSIPNLGMRQCTVTLARGAYPELDWYGSDSQSHVSWGYLDFE